MNSVPIPLIEAAAAHVGGRAEFWDLVTAPFSTRPVCRVVLDDGRSIVVKTGAPALASASPAFRWADLVDREVWMYQHVLADTSLVPTMLGEVTAEDWRGIVLEDLSAAQRVPPWSDEAVNAAALALADLHRLPVSMPLPADPHGRDVPQPYFERIRARGRSNGDLPTDLATESWWGWWESVSPRLEVAYQALWGVDRKVLVHNNVRSDNLFVRDGRAILFDWDHAILATSAYDSVYWAMGIEREFGQPAIEAHRRYLRHAEDPGSEAIEGVLAFWTGYFVDHLQAASARPVNQQLRAEYLAICLRWLAHLLGVSAPG